MATLRTDYVDDILNTDVNLSRQYNVTEYLDGSISLEDVTTYIQNGDVISANDLNTINTQINENTSNVTTHTQQITTINNTTIPNLQTDLQTQITANANAIDTLTTSKVNTPTKAGTEGQVLMTNGDTSTYWGTVSSGGGSAEYNVEPSNTTAFNADGSITQSFTTSGSTVVTTFNSDGSITEVYTNVTEGTVTTKNTVFNSDGTIKVTTSTV